MNISPRINKYLFNAGLFHTCLYVELCQSNANHEQTTTHLHLVMSIKPTAQSFALTNYHGKHVLLAVIALKPADPAQLHSKYFSNNKAIIVSCIKFNEC